MNAPSDYYISFNPDTSQGIFGDADGGPETALVMADMPCAKDGHMWTGEHFYILKGDFRAEYDALVKVGEGRWTLKYDVYDKFKHQYGSRWSSDFREWGRDGDRRASPPSTNAVDPQAQLSGTPTPRDENSSSSSNAVGLTPDEVCR